MTNYPAQIDTSISLPSAVDNLTPITGSVVNRLRDAILAIEKELGVKPSGIYSTVKSRIDTIESQLDGYFASMISLAGDLGGTLSNPLVIRIQGLPVSNVPPALNNVLVWSGIAWVPSAIPGGTTGGFASGDLSGNYPGPMTVVKLQNNAVKSGTLGVSNDGYVLTWVNANNDWEAKPSSGISTGGNTAYAGYGAPVALHNNGDLYYDLSQFPAQGYVQESAALPPTFNGSLSGTFSTLASFTSGTFTCGSTCKLLVAVIMFQQSTDQSVTSVTSAGLTFTRHNFVDNGGANSRFTRIEVWTAPVSSALSQTISIALSGVIDDASVYFFGLNNVNATAFDASADITGFNATGITSLSLTGVSTSNTNDLLLYAVGANATGPPVWAPATGFSKLANVYNAGGSQWSELQICFQSRTTTLSSTSVNTGVTTAIAAAAISFAVQGLSASSQWVQFGTPPMPVTTVANLPTAPAVGQRQVVIDSTTAAFNAAVAGGSNITVTVWWNGSNWVVG